MRRFIIIVAILYLVGTFATYEAVMQYVNTLSEPPTTQIPRD